MTEIRSAAVLGLGLIGGSLARDLGSRGIAVRGWDTDSEALDRAVRAGVVSALDDGLSGLREADLVVLATPIGASAGLLRGMADLIGPGTVVTDVGSTKRSVMVAAAEAGLRDRFVGSHPLAGDHRSGWDVSRTGLFDGARVFITAPPEIDRRCTALVWGMWELVGARPERIEASEHDRLMAWVSHAPQVLSSLLAAALADAGLQHSALGPGGRAMTRLAGSSSTLWTEILADNADEVAPALRSVLARLASLTEAIERGDLPDIRAQLDRSRAWAVDAAEGGNPAGSS